MNGLLDQHEIQTTSFRDPGGQVLVLPDRVLRLIRARARPVFERFVNSPAAISLCNTGKLVKTVISRTHLRGAESLFGQVDESDLVVEHERVPFVSYPYEWSPAMLAGAATLTIEIAEAALNAGFQLKDATPFNVLFRGAQPTFVDVLSFDERDPRESAWLAYAQFLRTFLYPLLVNKYFGLGPGEVFLTHRDGLEPEFVYDMAHPLRRISPGILGLVSMPRWLSRSNAEEKEGFYRRRLSSSPEQANFVLKILFSRLRKQVSRLTPAIDRSVVDSYMDRENNYSRSDFQRKDEFVRSVVADFRPARVLDVGCNNGYFSRIAASGGASVVSLDYSPSFVDAVWSDAYGANLDILPLHVNLARPAGGVGWANLECSSFLERASGHFDMVFMLAVIHHLLVSERVPIDRILAMAADLTTRYLVVEFVANTDSMFRKLARGRDELHRDFTRDSFEAAVQQRFEIVKSCGYESENRRLYLLEKK